MAQDGRSKFDPKKHHRKSIRLKGYDYSQEGSYYVTIVTYHRDCLFGEIVNEEIIQNGLGKIADECWRAIPEHFPFVEMGAYVILPNHAHGIIVITEVDRRGAAMLRPTKTIHTKSTSNQVHWARWCVHSNKSAVSYRINKEHNATGIWQRNYYERIIRNEREMDNIWRYIESNPAQWDKDDENP